MIWCKGGTPKVVNPLFTGFIGERSSGNQAEGPRLKLVPRIPRQSIRLLQLFLRIRCQVNAFCKREIQVLYKRYLFCMYEFQDAL